VGNRLRKGILALNSPAVRRVRGVGLMIGVELKQKAAAYVAALREEGVLTINAGATVIRFVPPLVMSEQEADEVVARVARVLEKIG
jgi:acetylornithine/LysW-gamma-L-lysine aminotransferase